MNASPNIELLPDADKLGRFADAVFRHADPRGYVSLRAFSDNRNDAKGGDRPIFVEPITVGDPQFRDVVTERARQAAQWPEPVVFCPPVVTFKNGKNAKAENVFEGVTLTVDCDQSPKAARATLSSILGQPTIVVASGGEWTNPDTGKTELKTHLHWRLTVPARAAVEHKQLREARSLALQIVGGDPSAAPPVHPLRWPGSWHRKGEPKLADIALQTDNEIDLLEALASLREAAGGSSRDVKFSRESNLEADNPDDVDAALKVIPNDNLSWAEWNNIGLAVYGATRGREEGAQAWAEWSRKAAKNDPEATAARWQHFHRSPPTRSGFGTLVYLARKHAPNWTPKSRQAEQPKTRFKFETISELRTKPEEEWLIEKWLPATGPGLIFGRWGAGKSFWAYDIAFHLGFGLPDWHGIKLPGAPMDVLIIAREGHQGFVKRADAFKQYHGIEDDTEHVQFMRTPISFVDDNAFTALKEEIERLKRLFKFVLVDTVGRVLPRVDMAKEAPITMFMERLQQIGEVTGAVSLGVHHENKSGDANGSMYFQNSSDFMFQMQREGDGPLQRAKIICIKAKDDEDEWSRMVTFKKIELPAGKSSLVVEGVATEDERSRSPSTIEATPRQKRALDALDEMVRSHGEPPPLAIKGMIAVAVDRWREELFARGILDKAAKNPRTDFKRIKDQLANKFLIGERNGLVWRAKTTTPL